MIFILQFTGPTILGLGIWFYLNIKLYAPVIDNENYVIPAYIVMGAGIVSTLVGILGCVGSMNDNKCFIAIVSILNNYREEYYRNELNNIDRNITETN
jgi:hypothetical protein